METQDARATSTGGLEWLAALATGGEMGERTRAFDWSTTPVGPIDRWPQSLKTALAITLSTRYPMLIWWGDDLTHFYNDAYVPVLGQRHPSALGRPAPEVWSEAWPRVGPQADAVMREGKSSWNEELLIVMTRIGYPEEVYMTFSYGPILDDAGQVGGVFCACTEETQRVLGRRRLRTLRALADRANEARTAEEACEIAARTLLDSRHDVPFALLYLLAQDGRHLALAGAAGVERASPAAPGHLLLDDADPPWPFSEASRTGKRVEVAVPERVGALPGGPWPEHAEEAVVLPFTKPGQAQLAGFVVAGVSPRRPLDAAYREFLDLVAYEVGAAVANARAYEEERRRAEALSELDRAKTVFFSNVSHEFRTPLTLMLGPLEDVLARRDSSLAPTDRSALDVVRRNGVRLLKLVNTLLEFSRIEAGRIEASYEPTDLSRLTAELASVFRSAVERAGLSLVVDCPPLGEPVHVDRDMWEKIVLNLVSNAFKFTFEGEIAVYLAGVNGQAELRVSDTGTGISEAELPRLFERFHRIKGARARTHEGTGIGLALVQELVKLHAGTIEVASSLGAGTTFRVRIPFGTAHLPADRIGALRTLAPTPVGARAFTEEALRWTPSTLVDRAPRRVDVMPAAAPSPAAGTAAPPRVLVADDNADMREYLVSLLGENCHVEAAPDGLSALEAVRRDAPDVVLADVMMPGLDGFDLLRRLRDDPVTREIPVILRSARAGEEARVEGLEAGADDYLVKPFSARELVARVRAHLELARVRRSSAEKLRESERKYRELFESLTEAYCVVEMIFEETGQPVDFRYLETNAAFEQHATRPMLGKRIKEIVPDFEQFWLDAYGRVALTGEPVQLEHVVKGLGDQWFRTSAFRVGGEGSRRVAVLFENVTARRRIAEEERERARALAEVERAQRVLVAELQHRSRNLLAVVRSIVSQTARSTSSVAELEAQLQDRLAALSRVHTLLSRSELPRVQVRELVEMELAATAPGAADRISVAGEEVVLPQRAVRTFGLALHELATNAVKYGALGGGGGRVVVTWRLVPADGTPPRLVLEWVESFALARRAPGELRSGFGRELVEHALPYELDAATELVIGEEGVRCRIELPVREEAR